MESKSDKINWKSILVTALVTLIVSIGSGIGVFYFQQRDPHLVFLTSDTIPYKGTNRTIGIYQVSVSNDGKKLAEDINCIIQIPRAKIEQFRISNQPDILASSSISGDYISTKLSELNPSEHIQISILASSQGAVPSRPLVFLRARGVNGVDGSTKSDEGLIKSLTLDTFPAVLGILAGTFSLLTTRRKRLLESDDEFHSDDQRSILAYLCSINLLKEDAAYYYSKQEDSCVYWSESDRLTANAISSNDISLVRNTICALTDLISYAKISAKSKSIILYNLARLHLFEGDLTKTKSYIRQSRAKYPKLINKRLQIDFALSSKLDEV